MESLPEGRYISAFGRVRTHAGGKTTAALARNRLLTTRFGVPTTVLTFDATSDYDEVRAELRRRGSLVPGMELLNLYEWYRDADSDVLGRRPRARATGLSAVEHAEAVDVPHRDGSTLATEYLDGDGEVVAHDYRRQDGSVFARVTRGGQGSDGGAVVLVDHDGRPARAWPSRRGWHRHWLRALTGGAERVFLFTDTKSTLEQLWPVADPRVLHVHVLHEVHLRTASGDLSTAPLHPGLAAVFDHLGRLDALVTLTDRQCRDVVEREPADRTRVVAVPHAAAPVEPGAPPERERATFVAISRLTVLKRVHQTIEAFALVVGERPHARLHVYGDGPLRGELAELVVTLGLSDHVVLHGYDPGAREHLRRATAFVSTSTKESFGLSVLEAMAHGCPVVAYDVPYGMAELVDDGVSGRLVADGDGVGLARWLGALADDPDEVARLSDGAVAGAARFAPERVAEAWQRLLTDLAR